MIQHSQAKYILLPEIYPNQDLSREPRNLAYNQALRQLHDGNVFLLFIYFEELKLHLNGEYYD